MKEDSKGCEPRQGRQPCSVIARPLGDARLAVEEAGAEVREVKTTVPPRGAPSGPLRVVRERWEGGQVCLVAAASLPPREEEGGHG